MQYICIMVSLKSALFVAFVAYAAYTWYNGLSPNPPPTNIREILGSEYDYVIVGAGSAGSVLANRLSEDPDNTVLLLEAGKDDAGVYKIHAPSRAMDLWGDTEVDWMYRTTPQKKSCLSMKNRQCQWPRGKVLGGSSSLNCMVYVRGSPHDYDRWEEMGAKGWAYKDVLPYFYNPTRNCLVWVLFILRSE